MTISSHDAERDFNEAMVLVNQIPTCTLWGNSTVSARPLHVFDWITAHCSLAVMSLTLFTHFMDCLH